ncbi:MAG: hypothetical protein ABWZ64_00030 [Xanthobacteraceae bacterium]
MGVRWTGSFLVPKWACVLVAGALLLFAPLLATVAITAIEQLAAFDRAAERRLLTLRASQLSMQAMAPGSPLTCLGTVPDAPLQASCEKALFSSAEATMAALSYVAAQLSLLDAAKHLRATDDVLADVRRSVEADLFGVAAHVLATSHGCTPQSCERLALLSDPRRVKANLAEGLFAREVRKHMAESPVPTAALQTPPSPVPPPKPPSSNIYIPSAASIPPVSIMASEPTRRDEAEASATSTSRKPAAGKEEERAAGTVNSGGIRGGPLQISPGAQ